MYQAKYCMQLAMVARPTAADMLQYARELPQEGDRLQRVHAQSTLTGLCTAGGLVGATGWALLRTRSAPLVLASAFLGTFSSHVVGDDVSDGRARLRRFSARGRRAWILTCERAFDAVRTRTQIASWVYGTYKFDGGRSNEEFLRWVVARRAA